MARTFLAYAGVVFLSAPAAADIGLVWPTPNRAWADSDPPAQYVQPTISGRVESAFFGCVRNGGARFHEGVDLKPISRDRRGEATDPVFAVMAGTVGYVNQIAGNSGYGRYVVIEHDDADPGMVTLYAHLAKVDGEVKEGARVQAGQTIGTMGRSAGGYTIPRQRAHVHFELGFRLSDDFDAWYEWRGYETRNRHGNYNGMNLIGLDPIEFYEEYRGGRARDVLDYVEQLPEAFVLRVRSAGTPDFVRRYPSLMERPWIPANLAGWEIGFTWFGLPKRWRALGEEEALWPEGERVTVKDFDRGLLSENSCRQMIVLRGDTPVIGSDTERTLQLLFGFR